MGAYGKENLSFSPLVTCLLRTISAFPNTSMTTFTATFISILIRELKQLGMTHMVYPGAVHSRFEHSLGVYWLAGEAIQKLKTYQGLELGIDQFDVQTVKVAGLLHDVGHGPFSHLFEHAFLPKVLNGFKWDHEQMSAKLIDHIVDVHHIDVESEMIKRVKEMILASSEFALPKSAKEKQFLYDIVANGRNGNDVDKLMETMRVLDDEICYRAKDCLISFLLQAVELMVVDALLKANSYLEISSSIQDPSEYWKLDDTIIKTIETAPDEELQESRDLILCIRRRNLYQFCNEYSVPKDKLEHFKNVTAQDIACSQDYESEEKFPIPDDRISHLLPTSYQDMIVRVYSKKPELVAAVSEAFENFQLQIYGVKAQVHATPEKKKRCL
ncbi:hypothetical protein CRYUN_Cryun24cG0109700 [Craigia yunnanensis]